jgi:hypothetical protein
VQVKHRSHARSAQAERSLSVCNLSEIVERLLLQGVRRVEEAQILGSICRIATRSACRSSTEDLRIFSIKLKRVSALKSCKKAQRLLLQEG